MDKIKRYKMASCIDPSVSAYCDDWKECIEYVDQDGIEFCIASDVEKLEQENAALYIKNEKLDEKIDELKARIAELEGKQSALKALGGEMADSMQAMNPQQPIRLLLMHWDNLVEDL